MENKDIKILLTESTFTQIAKLGRINYIQIDGTKLEIPLTTMDVRELCSGKLLMKKVDESFVQVLLQPNLSKDLIKEILKRTPLFSSLAEEII